MLAPSKPQPFVSNTKRVMDEKDVEEIRNAMESDERRHMVLRDFGKRVTSHITSAIWNMQRGALESADAEISSATKEVEEHLVNAGVPLHRWPHQAISSLVKAHAFKYFITYGKIIPLMELRFLSLENYTDYISGVSDCMQEIGRYAVSRATVGDYDSVSISREVVNAFQDQLIQWDFRNGVLRRKFDSIKYVTKRLNEILYEASLVTNGSDDGGEEVSNKRIKRERLDKAEFDALRQTMEKFDATREVVIKSCRDLQKAGKNAVYNMHRADDAKASSLLSDCERGAKEMLPTITSTPALRQGSFANAMEEYAEAMLFRHYLNEGQTIMPRSRMAELVNVEEYIGALVDFTGEVGRYAVARATERDRDAVAQCYQVVDEVQAQLMAMSLPPKFGKKQGELSRNHKKLEHIIYDLSIAAQGKMTPGVPGGGEPDPRVGGEVE